jgi:hypothetical protein
MKNLYIKTFCIIALFSSTYSSLQAFIDAHFWRATPYVPAIVEPRFEKSWLSSFDIWVGGGKSGHARNYHGASVPLLDIYGDQNVQFLILGVPNQNTANPLMVLLEQLSLLPTNGQFGFLSYHGDFSCIESGITVTQNIINGFFLQAYIPVRSLSICDICSKDLSLCQPTGFPSAQNPLWQSTLSQFQEILALYDLCVTNVKQTGIGDVTIFGGFTHNYEDTTVLDYVDVTLKLGVLIPTAHKKDVNQPFDMPLGYNGFIGMPIDLSFAFGAYEWLSVGGEIGVMLFSNHQHHLRMKTNDNQQGLIKLALGEANIHPGALWEGTVYVKADHIVRGLSLLAGYTFVNKNKDQIDPCNPIIFNPEVVNNDKEYHGFRIHTVHAMVEFDFTQEDAVFGPRVGLLYNVQVGGRRMFKTNLGAGSLGLDISWKF